MITSEERRRVAEALRGGFDIVSDAGGRFWLNGTLFGLDISARSEERVRGGLYHLADFIEPDPRAEEIAARAYRAAADYIDWELGDTPRVAKLRERAEELEAMAREHDTTKSAADTTKCDREALLDLAETLGREAEAMRSSAGDGDQMTMRLMRKVADTFSLVAETVRSACGGRAAGEPEFWRCPFTQGPCDDACMLATTVYATTPDFMDGTPTVDPDRPLGWSCTLRKDAGERYNAPRGEEA